MTRHSVVFPMYSGMVSAGWITSFSRKWAATPKWWEEMWVHRRTAACPERRRRRIPSLPPNPSGLEREGRSSILNRAFLWLPECVKRAAPLMAYLKTGVSIRKTTSGDGNGAAGAGSGEGCSLMVVPRWRVVVLLELRHCTLSEGSSSARRPATPWSWSRTVRGAPGGLRRAATVTKPSWPDLDGQKRKLFGNLRAGGRRVEPHNARLYPGQ